jgi:hypothetical protein
MQVATSKTNRVNHTKPAARLCCVESLEGRALFAATVTPLTSEPAAPFVARINFQPAGSYAHPGYAVDSGSTYGNRGNGLTYGWSTTNNKTSDRNNSRAPDQRYDTLNRIQSSTLTWQLAVPNGRYVVKVVAGDPSIYDGYYRTDVEGQIVIDGRPSSTNRWIEGTATVDVSDGRLTLRNASGAQNNKVCFIEVTQSNLPTTVTIGSSGGTGFTRSGPAEFLLRPAGTGTGVAKVEFFANGVKLGEDTTAPFGLFYRNVDPGDYSITTRVTNTIGLAMTSQAVPLTVKPGVIAWMTIGGSSNVEADRRVGWPILKTGGWSAFVNQVIKPQINWGARRIILHNPFGTLSNESMQMDQYLHARSAGLGWLTNGFAQAWKPITDRGVEVVAYFGTMEGDPDFNTWQWQQRFWDSVRPALDAGMTIALDVAGISSASSKSYWAAQALRSLGVEVYIEPRPAVDQPQWHDYGVISTDSFWDRSDPEKYPDSKWAAPTSMLRGEIIRAVIHAPVGRTWTEPSWLASYTRSVLADGHSVATSVLELIRAGVSLDDILA